MKMKTYEANSPEELDNYCNAFNEKFNVRFTQTHVLRNEGMKNLYIAIIFYEVPVVKSGGIEL